MAVKIKLTRTKGDVKDVTIDYVSVLESGVLEYEETGTGRITYLAVGSWWSVEAPAAAHDPARPGFR